MAKDSGSTGGGGGGAAAAAAGPSRPLPGNLSPDGIRQGLIDALQNYTNNELLGVVSGSDPTPAINSILNNKVLIKDAFDRFTQTDAGRGVTRAQFDSALLQAQREGRVSLSRFDLTGSLSDAGRSRLNQSRLQTGNSEFNLIRLDRLGLR